MTLNLSEREQNLISSSWKMLEHEAGIANQFMFYEEFFKVSPEAQEYFIKKGKVDYQKLSRKFKYTMNFIIDNLSTLGEKQSELEDLGSLHNKLNIDAKYYPLFNQAILNLLSEVLKERNTEEVKKAWRKMLDHISLVMQDAPEKKVNKFQELLNKLFS